MNSRRHIPAVPPPVLDTLLRRAPVHIFLFDAGLVCRYAAPTGDEFLGRSRAWCVGRHAAELLPPASDGLGPVLERAVREALAQHQLEYRFSRPEASGERRYAWLIEVEPMSVDEERGVMVAVLEVSDLIEERDELRRELEALRERERERRVALADVLNEVRNQLTPAKGYLQMIVRRPWNLRDRPAPELIAERVLPRLDEVVLHLEEIRDAPGGRG